MRFVLLLTTLSFGQTEVPPVVAFQVVQEMPDPFLFQDGHRVETLADWQKRREEILELLLSVEYGHVPPAPGNVQAQELESEEKPGGLIRKTFRLTMGPDHRIATTLQLYLPSGEGPYPVVIRFGMDAGPAGRLARRGYAYACFEHRELDPDTEGYDAPGPAQMLYPEYDWGSVAVWAWGASRVLDYLATRPDINVAQAAVTGHSRTGKAALLAGALDERFTLVVPNGSGCAGAAAYRARTDGVETLALLTLPNRFKSWLQRDFARFGGQETRLPFDQHFLRALVAPRVLLTTDALGDLWANPAGTQLAWMAAQPVFDFLGVTGNNLCHFRQGGHDQLPEDYDVLLDVADWHFKGKPLTHDFSVLPDPTLKPTWSWKAPDTER